MKGGGVIGVIGEEVVVYVYFGGYTQDVVNGRLSYVGGRTESMWMLENTGKVVAIKLVEHLLRESFRERKLWFSMKLKRRIVIPFGRDGDLLKPVKHNDEFVFMYVGGKDGLSHVALEICC